MKAQKVQRIKNSSRLIQISSVSGHSIKVTPNHKMLIKRNNKKDIVRAKDIAKKDKIATIGKLDISDVTIPSIKDFILENKVDIINYKFGPKLSYFISIMLGDGYSGAETNNGKIRYKSSPSIVGIDEEIFSHVKEICDQLKLNCRRTKTFHGTPQLVLGKNKWFLEFLVRCGVEKRDKKHISEKLMKMNLENTASLLRGLFDTDGYVNKRIGPGFSNISEKLIKQTQKMLLRFGIVSNIRKKKEGTMRIYDREYKTVPCFEVNIHQKKSIIDFYRFIGFNIKRKQEALINIIAKICSNLNYTSCNVCRYKIYRDIFSGRTKYQKEWGKIKLRVIELLGEKGELGSRELKKILNHEPRNNENRLNHHYELIKKRRIGSRSNTERFWSLNPIGEWIFNNILSKNKKIEEFFRLQKCPLCGSELEWIIKKGWRDSDFEGDIFWDNIREIKEVECEEDVYDIILPNEPKNDHMFVVNGFIVHNSYGLDLPAFRVVVRDLKRYGLRGMQYIPVLEYHQMAGRAGRPGKEEYGEAITIAQTEGERDKICEMFIYGEPEEITSKLAVEPVLRTYILSLIASGFMHTKQQIIGFFEKTFWAFQFKDMEQLVLKIEKMLLLLEDFGFIVSSKVDFVSAHEIENEKYNATEIGIRVAQLYIDPLTADYIINSLKRAQSKQITSFSLLQLVSSCLELRPLLRVKAKEYEEVQQKIIEKEDELITMTPNMYDIEYDDFINSVKTGLFFGEWIEEKDEEYILEKYDIRPGEIRAKLDIADWLIYSSEELAKLLHFNKTLREIVKLRLRMNYGAKEELLPLLKLKNIGRVRARKLYSNGLKDLGELKKADINTIAMLIGKNIAIDVKQQLGQDVDKIKVKENKRKGQISLMDY